MILLLVVYRDYLPGEPSPFMIVNLEIASKSSVAREVGTFIFPVVWIGSLASIVLSPFLSIGILRVSLTAIFLTSWLFNIAFLKLSQESDSVGIPKENMIDSGTLAFFWALRQRLLETLETYSELIPTIVAFACILLIFAWKPSPKVSIRGKWNIAACLPIAVVVAMALYSRGGTSTFPTPVGLPIRFASAIAAVAKQDEVAEQFHARPVTLHPEKRRFEKIILIMDESVRAGFVDSTLFERLGLIDYGATVSVGNCSHFSRFIFKRGFREADLPNVLIPNGLASEEPTMWQFAKSAGFKTVYIDALDDGVFHDGINSDERSYIDEKYHIHTQPNYLRDFDALKRLTAVMSRPGSAFIFLDKQGAHHAYQNKYPPGQALSFEGPPVRPPENKDLREYQRDLLGRYNRAVDWSANRFMSELFAHGLPEDTLLIYTSDHGQSLVENNTKLTHCTSGPITVDGEGLVPLFVYLRQDTPFSRLLGENGRKFHDRYSDFQVFPTVLIALGYSRQAVTQSYGSSLLDPPPATRRFLKGGDVHQLEWQTVE
ncbi:MAG: sulfatase-like hydrolase/transferase [Proteobacteria bacterium]|nr:sulfatase-like hydrolase/transferase [Pseudomonadota bacterium]